MPGRPWQHSLHIKLHESTDMVSSMYNRPPSILNHNTHSLTRCNNNRVSTYVTIHAHKRQHWMTLQLLHAHSRCILSLRCTSTACGCIGCMPCGHGLTRRGRQTKSLTAAGADPLNTNILRCVVLGLEGSMQVDGRGELHPFRQGTCRIAQHMGRLSAAEARTAAQDWVGRPP